MNEAGMNDAAFRAWVFYICSFASGLLMVYFVIVQNIQYATFFLLLDYISERRWKDAEAEYYKLKTAEESNKKDPT